MPAALVSRTHTGNRLVLARVSKHAPATDAQRPDTSEKDCGEPRRNKKRVGFRRISDESPGNAFLRLAHGLTVTSRTKAIFRAQLAGSGHREICMWWVVKDEFWRTESRQQPRGSNQRRGNAQRPRIADMRNTVASKRPSAVRTTMATAL